MERFLPEAKCDFSINLSFLRGGGMKLRFRERLLLHIKFQIVRWPLHWHWLMSSTNQKVPGKITAKYDIWQDQNIHPFFTLYCNVCILFCLFHSCYFLSGKWFTLEWRHCPQFLPMHDIFHLPTQKGNAFRKVHSQRLRHSMHVANPFYDRKKGRSPSSQSRLKLSLPRELGYIFEIWDNVEG